MLSGLRAWLGGAKDCLEKSRSLHWLFIAIGVGVFAIAMLLLFRLSRAVGPVIGAVISVIAVLGNEAARYCSSTSNLRLSLGLESKEGDPVIDPGLDVEVFGSQDCRRYRVSAMVINDGKAVIRDAKASLTIKVRKGNQVTHYLGDVLMRRNEINNYVNKFKECIEKYERNEDTQCLSNKDVLIGGMLKALNCENFLVNEYNPHVIGESLAWALPESNIPRPNIGYQTVGRRTIKNLIKNLDSLDNLPKDMNVGSSDRIMFSIIRVLLDTFKDGLPIPWPITDYQHITSISPGQRNRLLIFSYVRLSDNEYLVMPYSEYGAPGPRDPSIRPYRACLRLDKDHELIFDITVHGEGARSPLRFRLCITYDKLANIDRAVEGLKEVETKGIEQGQFDNLLKALNDLKCRG